MLRNFKYFIVTNCMMMPISSRSDIFPECINVCQNCLPMNSLFHWFGIEKYIGKLRYSNLSTGPMSPIRQVLLICPNASTVQAINVSQKHHWHSFVMAITALRRNRPWLEGCIDIATCVITRKQFIQL